MPEEEKELGYLHGKQNRGIGNLSPKTQDVLAKLRGFKDAGNVLNP